jgi:PIN domain nuclease of toxin-antitoxin system
MRFIIDTHVFIWFSLNDSRLPTRLRQMLKSADQLYLSAASAWEMSIKFALGKLDVYVPIDEFIPKSLTLGSIDLLDTNLDHIIHVSKLLHHRDPFDRMLIAQCLIEKIPIVSADATFDAYGVERIW